MSHAMHKMQISQSALESNLKLLSKNTKYFMPVVKFNAYGHGLCDIAKLCKKFDHEKKLVAFAVGNINEGVSLRKSGIQEDILALLGEIPLLDGISTMNKEDIRLAKENNIITVAHNKETLNHAVENNVPFALKWNTGMNRLGFAFEDIPYILEYIENKKINFKFNLSHLPMCDNLSSEACEFSNAQANMLKEITKKIKEKFPHVLSSMGQSGSILANEKPIADVSRLGVAMYGVNPFYGTEWEETGKGLKPVMNICAPILSVREIEKDNQVGYCLGSKTDKKSKIAVVAIGYSNSYRRSVVSEGVKPKPVYAYYQGKRISRLANVCMQLSFFDVSSCEAREGDYIYLLGGEGKNAILPEELAKWWDTIAYEVLCQLSITNLREIIK